jgi:prevent-host-death family protein
MTQFNMHDAKTRLSELVQMAERGEEVIIARNGKPAVRMVEIVPEVVTESEPKKTRGAWGSMKGKIWYSPDFDQPDEELINSFYDGDPYNPNVLVEK